MHSPELSFLESNEEGEHPHFCDFPLGSRRLGMWRGELHLGRASKPRVEKTLVSEQITQVRSVMHSP